MNKLILTTCILFFSCNCLSSILMNSSINSKTHNDIQDLLKASFYSEILDRVSKTKMSTTDNLTPNRGARGRQIIEAIKQKNRESIAKMRGFDPEKIATSKDIISALILLISTPLI